MTVTAPSPTVRAGLETLAWTRRLLLAMLESTPDEHFYRSPCPGANHAAWVAGHIAASEDGLRVALGGGESVLDASYASMFGMGQPCRDGSAGYPSRAELMSALGKAREAAEAWFSGMSEDDLKTPVKGELSQFAKTLGEVLGAYAGHESFHAGQVSVARRAAGLPPLF